MPPALPEAAPAPTLADGAPDPHADDSYCALCRRCQMRKKLERRLAAKKEGTPTSSSPPPPNSAAARLAAPAALCAAATGPPDDAPLDELLLFIGADATPGPASRARRKRRAKKNPTSAADESGEGADGAAGSMCLGTSMASADSGADFEVHAGGAGGVRQVARGGGARLGEGEDDVAGKRREDSLRVREMHSPVSDEGAGDNAPNGLPLCSEVNAPAPCCRSAVAATSDRPALMNALEHMHLSAIHAHAHARAHAHNGACQHPHDLIEADFTDEDMTPEEQHAIDQEVEAFRLSLEVTSHCFSRV